jgi:hypothetical protein
VVILSQLRQPAATPRRHIARIWGRTAVFSVLLSACVPRGLEHASNSRVAPLKDVVTSDPIGAWRYSI